MAMVRRLAEPRYMPLPLLKLSRGPGSCIGGAYSIITAVFTTRTHAECIRLCLGTVVCMIAMISLANDTGGLLADVLRCLSRSAMAGMACSMPLPYSISC